MLGNRIPLYMSWQSLYPASNVQIDCKWFVDSRVERIYFEVVASCVSMSSRVTYLGVSLWFVIGPTMWCSSLELVCHELDILLLGCISHVKELLYFVDPIQEGFNIKVPTKRRYLNLYSIFIRTWMLSFSTMIRWKSTSHVRIRISESSSPHICHLSIFIDIFKVVFLRGCSILPSRKDFHIENSIEDVLMVVVIVAVVDVVVVVVMVVVGVEVVVVVVWRLS